MTLYQILVAEAKKLAGGGLEYLNTLGENRGLVVLGVADVPDQASFLQAVLDEHLAELNFEGHRLFDLVRYQKKEDVPGVDNNNALFSIPQREITATKEALIQNPGL
jgi:hypothetical protein